MEIFNLLTKDPARTGIVVVAVFFILWIIFGDFFIFGDS